MKTKLTLWVDLEVYNLVKIKGSQNKNFIVSKLVNNFLIDYFKVEDKEEEVLLNEKNAIERELSELNERNSLLASKIQELRDLRAIQTNEQKKKEFEKKCQLFDSMKNLNPKRYSKQ